MGGRGFGLEDGTAAVLTVISKSGPPVVLRCGSPTLSGNRFYLQRIGDPGVFVADRALRDALPKSPDEWRDRSLFVLPREGFDRVELSGKTEFRADRDTNGIWRLKRPLEARADGGRMETMIALLERARVERFVSDQPVSDLETFGLQKPEAELILGRGAQDLVRLSFGGLSTGDPAQRYALRRDLTNLVTVPAATLESLIQPLADFRDRRLLPPPGPVTALEFVGRAGEAGFRVERTNLNSTNWWVTSPKHFPADPEIMEYFLRQFELVEIADFTADVVTDLARFGLQPPVRDYRLLRGTNLAVEIQFGIPFPARPTLLAVRRTDEPSVYGLPVSVLAQFADSAQQLHDWHFSVSNVMKLRVQRPGSEGVLVRTNGGWVHPLGRMDSILAANLELSLGELGAVRSDRYSLADPRQEQQFRQIYHLSASPLTLVIELSPGSARGFTKWRLEFGGELGGSRVALARFDDDPTGVTVKVPSGLFGDLLKYLAW